MPDVQIINESPMTMAEVLEELESIKKRDKELSFRATKTEEYLKQFAEKKRNDPLKKKLIDLEIPRLKEAHISKLVDIQPTTAQEVKACLQGYPLSITNESITKIVAVFNE